MNRDVLFQMPRRLWLAPGLLGMLCLCAASASAETNQTILEQGEKIYQASCLNCHGDQGKGNEEHYSDPLIGDLAVGGLAELISETMPEEDPDSCVAEDAEAVAAYIHHSFYSEAARVRNRPPRVALARLTGEQLRQSLADLYGHFQGETWTENSGGVSGSYFDGSRWKKDMLKIERTDRVIDFDFGKESPGDGISDEEFYINWTGSLKVDHSGRYEIILRSSLSCMMDFGADDRELVNNHVQSEGKEEFRRTLHLTAGRAYPFSMEFIQRKRKTEQPPAQVSLSWVPPNGTEEIIPSRNLIPSRLPATYALQAKLPPDDRSYGYERGTAVNRQWDDSTTEAAIEFASVVASELYPRYRRKHQKDPNDDRQILRGFLSELIAIAHRGSLDDESRRRFIDSQLELAEDDQEAIKRSLLLALKSPRFLYPTLDADRGESQRVANRLALVLFDSLPSDAWLVKQIEKDQLRKEEPIKGAAWKMVSDFRCRAKIRAFLHHWFDLAEGEEITKDQELFPGFDEHLLSDLHASVDSFIDAVVWSETSDFRQLLQADWSMTNDRLEQFYGEKWKPVETPAAAKNEADDKESKESANAVDATEADPLRRSISDSRIHVGLLGHPLLMSQLGYHRTSSPIHRGVFLTRYTLGRVLRPPNAAFTPLNPDLHPKLTTRDRVELQTGEVNCQVCHQKINPLGFALESFDAVGRFREQEKDQPINARGGYVDRAGERVEFDGPRQLGDYLASSEDCHRAFVEAAFEHFVKQPIAAFGEDASDRLTKSFQESGFHIQQLIVSITLIAAEPPPTPGKT